MRLNLSGRERHNLVPVDWVAAVIAHIFRHKEKHGRCYQLASPQPVLAREVYELLVRYFNICGPRYVGPGGLDPDGMNELEKKFYEYASRYEPVWTGEPVLDCSNTLAAAPDLPCTHPGRSDVAPPGAFRRSRSLWESPAGKCSKSPTSGTFFNRG